MTTAEKLRMLANERGYKEQLKRTKDAIHSLEIAIDNCMNGGSNIRNKSKVVIGMAKVLVAVRVLEHIVGDKPVGERLRFELDRQIEQIQKKEVVVNEIVDTINGQ